MKKMWWIIALGLMAAGAVQAAPRAALFVQNQAGAKLESQLDAFNDLVSTRLSAVGIETIRAQDVLARFTESRASANAQELRQAVEALQTLKAEGTVDGPLHEAAALRTAQLMGADFLVFASLLSLGENQMTVQAYGLAQQQHVTTLRVALRVLDGNLGTQLYGDTVAVSEKVLQNSNMQVQLGDLVNTLLDRGAEELAGRVRGEVARIEAAQSETPALASVTIQTAAEGAAVELDGVVVGTAPGVFQIRPGVHEIRLTREGYATWEKSVALADGQVLNVPMELSGGGIARKGELEAQDIAREQSAAAAQAATTLAGGAAAQASNSYIRLEGMPQSLSIGNADSSRGAVNVIQQQ